MHIAFLNLNGRIYYGESDSLESAQELAKPWLVKAERSYPNQAWRATIIHVLERTEVSLAELELGRELAA